MPRARPNSVTVLAIMNLVFGVVGFLCLLFQGAQVAISAGSPGGNPFGGAGSSPQQAEMQKEMQKTLDEKLPYNKAYTYAGLAVDFVICSLLVGGGFGLLQMQQWGRLLSLCYAVLSILFKIAQVAYTVVYVIPAIQEFARVFQAQAKGAKEAPIMAQAFEIGAWIGAAIPLVTAIYPVVVLIILLMPSVAAAFRGERPDLGPQDYDDRYADER